MLGMARALTLVWIMLLSGAAAAQAAAPEESDDIDFERSVLPILLDHCFACHGPDESARQGELRLDLQESAIGALPSGRRAIVPGDPAQSELWRRLVADDDSRMPPRESGKQRLSAEQIDVLQRWIAQGAKRERHWSFVAPESTPPPRVARSEWTQNPIDAFVLARLRREQLSPAGQANRAVLLRRATLDLTGLPPSPDEVDAFIADPAPDAYERRVDRLLSSPRYGERMAIAWLDVARYADTHGYLFDTERFMWRWRDWVIDAFNRDVPFDQFTVQQLAGDLLPGASEQDRIGSGFNRNHIINNEAGATPQEYLVENVIDRVNTTATVWMGLTLGCCQCHDHKYDPFTQREFYQLYAFFNNVPEAGLDGLNTNAKPMMPAPTQRDRRQLSELAERLATAEKQFASLAEQIDAAQSTWELEPHDNWQAPVDGLLAHWTMDQSAVDAVRGDAPAVFEAAAASYTEEGVLGAAAAFDGLRYVNAGERFAFSANDAFSFAAWLRPTATSGRMAVFSRMEDAKQLFRGYTLQLIDGKPAFFLLQQFPDNMIQVQAKLALEPSQWQHVAVTYDGSGKAEGVKIYVNGLLAEPGLVVDKLTGPIASERPFWIANGHPDAKWKGLVDEFRVYGRVLGAEELVRLPGLAIESLLATPPAQRTTEQAQRIRLHFLEHNAPPQWREPFRAIDDLKRQLLARRRAVPTVMVMQELPRPRETRMLERGAFDRPSDIVTPDTPAALPPLPQGAPRNRLTLARWLIAPQHPLTARVAVNRLWQLHFGRGLVRTAEDFGVQGERPSHLKLLDWLATEFVNSGWDVKHMQRLMVTSSVYRQSSRVKSLLADRNPGNRLLARGPRDRLPAELIRDQALGVSGLLVGTVGGPSVKPYQPVGLWREVAFDLSGANLTAQIYVQDQGASLYRRSLYTFWKRTAPPPTMLVFDAPDRERCVVRRESTNTPLQALVLMNDPTYVEASRQLAERIMREAGPSVAARIQRALRLTLGREPHPEEVRPLQQLFHGQRARFSADPQAAAALLSVGESAPDASLDCGELAAYAVVASVILTLDETVTKP